jgi:hypothetical protein
MTFWPNAAPTSALQKPPALTRTVPVVALSVSPIFEPTAQIICARVAIAKKEWARAETDGRHARKTWSACRPTP